MKYIILAFNIVVEDMDLRQLNRVRVMDQDLRQPPPIQIPITQPLSSLSIESNIPQPLL